MIVSTLTSLLLAFSLPAAHASQIFSNTGTTSGWDSFTHENQGTVQEVTNVVFKGPSALKMTQVHDSSYSGRYHSEAVKNNIQKRGDTAFYGFAFRLQADWEFDDGVGFNLAQFVTDFSDLGCSETYLPGTMIWIIGDQLATRVKTGSVCPQSQQKTKNWTGLATVSPGEWHRIVIQANWQSDSTGFLKIWFDGDPVLAAYNIETTVTDGRAFDFRVGLYANYWYDHGYSGNQPTRQVWFDQVGVGSTFADADPAQWG